MALITDPNIAKRKARAIASDILIYNKEKLHEGILNDNVFELLHEMIEEGREYYEGLLAPELKSATNFFNNALVDVLIKSCANVKSKIW